MGQRVVSAFQAQFVPQCVNLFHLRLDQVSGFRQIVAQGNRRFPLICLRSFRVLTQGCYDLFFCHFISPSGILSFQPVVFGPGNIQHAAFRPLRNA